ncbi:hypothetical protein J2Z62_000544 [Mycoplasmoides fastidiosum]|uniref:Uncharacterized protein n=1 Tax=Mycoplasmoides fastidiosum TaxID=92758 RepID=A0ABU0LZG9_9BACT|nr:hypothetical protein [Mycoplasmoides fastidiosum]MDQ0514106.1 hypothetical protein [Mycoplasmoides fastidiosum]UUD37486.1 hypothetical protein NPA10_02850 [Mycoplasmoides fastidiosum]
MFFNKRNKRIFSVFLIGVLAVSSGLGGFFLYQRDQQLQAQISTTETPPPMVNEPRNQLPKEVDLKASERINLIDHFRQKEKLVAAVGYRSHYDNIIYQIREDKLEPLLKDLVKNAIITNQKGLLTSDQFNGKIYFKINNLDLSVDVIVQWDDQIDFDKKYYDHFQISFAL